MSDSMACSAPDLQTARRINEEARNDLASSVVGKLVGIVDGRIVAVADDLDEVVERRIGGE
jgi:hypothetical protein